MNKVESDASATVTIGLATYHQIKNSTLRSYNFERSAYLINIPRLLF